jgi:hypothetical protein
MPVFANYYSDFQLNECRPTILDLFLTRNDCVLATTEINKPKIVFGVQGAIKNGPIPCANTPALKNKTTTLDKV